MTAFGLQCHRQTNSKDSENDKGKQYKHFLQDVNIKEDRVTNIINSQILIYLGHIKRHSCFERTLTVGAVPRRRVSGRPAHRWALDITNILGMSVRETGTCVCEYT